MIVIIVCVFIVLLDIMACDVYCAWHKKRSNVSPGQTENINESTVNSSPNLGGGYR